LKVKKIASYASLLALGGFSMTIQAQSADQNPNPGPSSAEPVLEEITITSQRRVENLQDVPIAVTAISGDQLEGKAIVRLSDLQFASPALSITDAGLTQSVNIRGIGLASGSPAVANGVATYVDGLFQPPIVTTNRFYDIASVEVLRGPQGTLVGSNSTGGAIFINTQNPVLTQFGGYGEISAGNYNEVTTQGAVNLPVGDTFAFRAAGDYVSRESFYDSVGPAYTDAGGLEERSGRLSLLWKPGAFQALGKIEYTNRNTGGYAYRPIPGTEYALYAPAGDFNLSYDTPEENHERGLISAVELRYELPNQVTLRSLTGYQDKNIDNVYDTDATSEATAVNPRQVEDQHVREREWTQEINVISPTEGRYNWIVGAYVQRNKIDVDILQTSGGFPTNITNPQNKTTTGWFGQINFKLTDKLELQTGLRYSTFDVDGVGAVIIGNGIPGFPPGGLQVANLSGSHRDDRPTGKVALNYKLDENDLLYAFVARGYKPGGFNSSTSEFDPETVWDYEAGWKGTLLNGHLRTQFGGFFNRYSDFQFGLTDLTTGNNGVANLPSATIKGFEAQVQAQLGGLSIDAGAAYVDSELGSAGPFVNTRLLPPGTLGPQCPTGVASNPPVCFNYGPYLEDQASGPNLYSPKWTFNAGVDYRFDLADNVSLTPRLNYAYVGSQFTSLSYSYLTDYLPSRGLLSALVTLQLPHNWYVEGYGTNLANKIYISGQFGNNEFFGAPRQYGVRVGNRF
jgi:iron complex outermembrane recepter protein